MTNARKDWPSGTGKDDPKRHHQYGTVLVPNFMEKPHDNNLHKALMFLRYTSELYQRPNKEKTDWIAPKTEFFDFKKDEWIIDNTLGTSLTSLENNVILFGETPENVPHEITEKEFFEKLEKAKNSYTMENPKAEEKFDL